MLILGTVSLILSPVYNAIRDKKVFEKGWKALIPMVIFCKCVLDPFRECQSPWSSVQGLYENSNPAWMW